MRQRRARIRLELQPVPGRGAPLLQGADRARRTLARALLRSLTQRTRLGLLGWRYQLLPVPPGLLAETVRALPKAGFRGANVTIPHKEEALALADRATDAASAIGAANTLIFGADGTIEADNTDAPALIDA